jgi:hypothetical protein
MPLLERDLAAPVARHFKALGYRVFAEVEIAGRLADLVALGPGRIVAMELKLHAWRQAVRQAMAYQLGADWAYVALPLRRAQDAYRSRHALEGEGIGMLAIDVEGGVRTVLAAQRSPRQLPSLREHLRDRVRRGARGHRADGTLEQTLTKRADPSGEFFRDSETIGLEPVEIDEPLRWPVTSS